MNFSQASASHIVDIASVTKLIDPARRVAAEKLLNKYLNPCYSGSISSNERFDLKSSRIGGKVFLPEGIAHPCDRMGKPMILVGQLNFAELPPSQIKIPRQGIFMLFWNSARDYSNPKDRHAFRCVWIDSPDDVHFAESQFSNSTIGAAAKTLYNSSVSLPEHDAAWSTEEECNKDLIQELVSIVQTNKQIQLFGTAGSKFDILQELAAFAGNGVSWSVARRTDSCFSHLVESSGDWKLLWKISAIPECGLDLTNISMFLLIRNEHLESHNFEKAWLLFC